MRFAGAWLFIVLCTIIFADRYCLSARGRAIGNTDALMYYANETSPEIMSSDNYVVFLRALEQNGSESAKEIRHALIEDVENSPKTLQRDVNALSAAARRANVALFVFSNVLAQRGQYLSFPTGGNGPVIRHFDQPAVSDNPLLTYSPLSRPEYLRASLDAVRSELNTPKAELAIIFKSHGSFGVPLMPRVNFDFTRISATDLRNALDDVSHDDLKLPDLQLQGITQAELWKILDVAGRSESIQFPFVFLSSCESGPVQFHEVLAIPNNVDVLVHSGVNGMSSEAIDYSAIFSHLDGNSKGLRALIEALKPGLAEAGQNLQIDTALTAWRHPFLFYLSYVPVWFFCLPFALWLLWVSLSYLFSRPTVRSRLL